MAKKEDEISFEQAFEKLEALAGRLETGDIPLEESLKAYEEGLVLLKVCMKKLDDAELRLQKLTRDDAGDFRLEMMN